MPSLISILSTFEIIGAATAYTLGLFSYEWVNSFMNTFIEPLVSKIFKKDINNISINLFKTKFKIGNFLLATIDLFFVFLFILFMLRFILKDTVKKIINDKNENDEKMIKFLEDITKWKIPIIQK